MGGPNPAALRFDNLRQCCVLHGFRLQFALRSLRVAINLERKLAAAQKRALRSSDGVLGVERLFVVRAPFDSYSSVHRRARRPHRAEPTARSLSFADQDAALLPYLRPQSGALGNRQGLRV